MLKKSDTDGPQEDTMASEHAARALSARMVKTPEVASTINPPRHVMATTERGKAGRKEKFRWQAARDYVEPRTTRPMGMAEYRAAGGRVDSMGASKAGERKVSAQRGDVRKSADGTWLGEDERGERRIRTEGDADVALPFYREAPAPAAQPSKAGKAGKRAQRAIAAAISEPRSEDKVVRPNVDADKAAHDKVRRAVWADMLRNIGAPAGTPMINSIVDDEIARRAQLADYSRR